MASEALKSGTDDVSVLPEFVGCIQYGFEVPG